MDPRDYTFLQSIEWPPADGDLWALGWVQVCRFAEQLPPGFELFGGRGVELGFDRLELPKEQLAELLIAVASDGVRLPGADIALRVPQWWYAIFEPARGHEPTLPGQWPEGLLVQGDPEPLWIGTRVFSQPLCPAPPGGIEVPPRVYKEKVGRFDLEKYIQTRHGWILKGNEHPLPW